MAVVTVSLSHQNLFKTKLDYDSEINMYTDSNNLVIGACEMLRIRKKICDMYPDKDVMVAPCLSKLYISRELKMFDFDGKVSPNWFYFNTGIISVIYDVTDGDLMLALFDETDVRLLWCLKWAEYIKFQTQTSNFHILNTKEDSSTHVGILYDNKDVAGLTFNTVNVIYKNLAKKKSFREKEDFDCPATEKTSSKNKLLRSLSIRRSYRQKESASNKKECGDEKTECSIKRKVSIRDSLKKKTAWSCKNKASSEDIKNRQAEKTVHNNCENGITKHAASLIHQDEVFQVNNIEETQRKVSEENEKESRRKLFKLRRISRTRSLITPKRDSQISHDEIKSDSITKKISDQTQFQRTKRLVKQRACTDTLILHDKTMKAVIDAAHTARFSREKKNLLKNMKSIDLEGTDLCVTEL